jgi:predicted site-specific integrase-resolvase
VPYEQTPSETILVKDVPDQDGVVAGYARVSSSDQRADLDRQIVPLLEDAHHRGWAVAHTVGDVGSGLNGYRPKVMTLLADPLVKTIVVEHRNLLMRFGCEDVEAALRVQGRRMVVVDPGAVKDDLVQDMRAVLTSFGARLNGRRSARNKANKALEAIQHEDEPCLPLRT